MNKKRISIHHKTFVKTYKEFYDSFSELKRIYNKLNGISANHVKLSALIMASFTYEAFLNYIGNELFKSWESFERNVNPIAKTLLIGEKLNLKINIGISPFNEINQLFIFRNQIAHGKPITLEKKDIIFEDEYKPSPCNLLETNWQVYLKKTNLNKIEELLLKSMKQIFYSSGIKYDFFCMGTMGSVSIELLKE